VVYNQEWTTYYETYIYRMQGAEKAAKYGAAAALVRSIASKSIYSVHAGVQYNKDIPVAAITV
jgi:carboxypeptidase Q